MIRRDCGPANAARKEPIESNVRNLSECREAAQNPLSAPAAPARLNPLDPQATLKRLRRPATAFTPKRQFTRRAGAGCDPSVHRERFHVPQTRTDGCRRRKTGMKIDRHATSIGLFPGEATLSAKTAIVFGVARGGTSMAAGAARGLGFYMGHALENNEDLEFSYKSLEHMKNMIRARNVQYRKWGWKFPAAANYLDDLLAHVRNPHLIVVCRDLAATSAGHVRWHQRETSFAISDILLQTQKNIL